MSLRRLELALAAGLVLQLLALWLLRPQPPAPPPIYFQAAALAEGALSAIELTNRAGSVRFERDQTARWRLAAPLDSRVDEPALRSLVQSFHRPIEATIQLVASPTPTDLADHGLGPDQRIHFRAESGPEVALELWVGAEQDNGMTCFQVEERGPILLGRLPARFRLERPPGAWRSRTLVPFRPEAVTSLQATGPAGVLALVRNVDGTWVGGAGMPAEWRPDQRDVRQLVELLGSLEARDVEPVGGPLADQALRIEVVLQEQGGLDFQFGAARGASVPVRVTDRPETFYVPAGVVQQLSRGPSQLADRQILAFDLTALRSMRARRGEDTPWHELRPGPDFGVDPTNWLSPEPGRMVDGQRARFAARTAANLRAVAAPRPGEALADPRETGGPELVFELGEGQTERLWLGTQVSRGGIAIARGDDPRVFLAPERVARALLEPFALE